MDFYLPILKTKLNKLETDWLGTSKDWKANNCNSNLKTFISVNQHIQHLHHHNHNIQLENTLKLVMADHNHNHDLRHQTSKASVRLEHHVHLDHLIMQDRPLIMKISLQLVQS